MRFWIQIGVASLLGAIVAGCGGGVSQRSSLANRQRQEPTIRGSSFSQQLQPAAQARAEEFTYQGWQALRLTNGLVTVVAVPAIGGRIMEYKLGDHPFLWVNPDEAGQLYDPPQTEEERAWHNYGGSKVWLAPQSQWGGPPDPLGSKLDSGQWTGSVVTPQGRAAEIVMVSPPDEQVTGLQITRRIKITAGTTRLEVTDSFKNVGAEAVTWSVAQVSQVRGSLSASKYNEESCIYLPLNAASKDTKGFWTLVEGGAAQFQSIEEGRLLRVSYHNEQGKIAADSTAGCMAHVDELHEFAFLKRFTVQKTDDYPDEGATVEIYSSGDLSYMEMAVLSPLHTLQPGEEFSFATQWYATRVGGPIRDATELAAFREPLRLEPAEQGLQLTGELGVFAPGTLKISLVDPAGQTVGAPLTLPVNPAETVVLDRRIAAADSAEKVTVTLENEQGSALGVLAELPLATRTAQVH